MAALGYKTALLEHVISRLDPLDDFSAFDFLLLNIHGALGALGRNLPGGLPAPLLHLIPVVAGINSYIAKVGISAIATTSDSGRLEISNPTFGKFQNHPLYACFAEDATDLPLEAKERIHLCLGLLLLARLGIEAPPSPTKKEIEIADGLRKSVSNEAWFSARNGIPKTGKDFLERVRAIDRHNSTLANLTETQKDFFVALASLADAVFRSSGIASVHGMDRTLLDDDEADENGAPVRIVRFLPTTRDDESDPEDGPDPIEFVETPSTPIKNSSGLKEHRVWTQASYAAQRFARDNQFLPNRWRALIDQEAIAFVTAARCVLAANGDAYRRRQALVASLVFITSHSPSALASFVLVKNRDEATLDICMSEHVIDVERRIWWHRWPSIPGRFSPDPGQESFLQPSIEWIPLAMPPEVCSALDFAGSEPILLSRSLSSTPEDMEVLHKEFCQSLHGKSNRTSPARVRAHGFDYLVRQTGDDTFASAVQGTLEYAPYSPLYYYACRAEDAVAAHASRLTSVGWIVPPASTSSSDGVRFGSRLQPTKKVIQDLVQVLARDLSHSREAYDAVSTPETIARFHNAMVLFTAVMAISATGHRKAKEYSFVRWTLDLANLFLMASDKILSTALSTRQVSIPRMLAEQFRAYFLHLEFLASRVTRYNPTLAAQIRSLTQPDAGGDAVPLLFLLSHDLSELVPLSHEELRKHVGDDWPLPWHAARHMLESATRERGLSAEFNHYRAGHISTGQQPFSATSPLVPEDVAARSAEIVDGLLAEQGWSVQVGLSGRRRPPGHFERAAASQLGRAYLPAPIIKAQVLVEESNVKVVNAAIAVVKKTLGKQTALNDDAVESIRQEILNASVDRPFLAVERLNLFRKMLGTRNKTGEFRVNKLPGLAAQLDERPAFEPDAAWRIRQAEAMRQGFLDSLALHASSTLEDALDRIAFSLIAFAAFTAPNTVVPALQACFSRAFTLEGFLWIEFPRKVDGVDEEVREWIRRPLDPVTTCLVLLARARFGTEIPAALMTDEAVPRSVLRLARLAAQHASLPVEAPGTLKDVCRSFIPYFRFRLPGIHAAWCEGRLVSVSMARPDFLRAMTGQRPADPGRLPEIDAPDVKVTAMPKRGALAYVEARKLMRRIGQILMAARPDSVAGGKKATHYAQKIQIARKDMQRLASQLAVAPIILQALAAWITQLMTEGGPVKDKLQASSIATYFWAIGYPLIEFFFEEDIAALDSAALEDLYADSLDARSPRTRVKRARVLRQFHVFCTARYGLAEVDWYEIEPLIDSNTDYIDANIVTPVEFKQAMAALQSDIDAGNIAALKVAVLMLIMYRAGLRLGEAFRLTLDDFILDGGACILFIRGNRYGKPKTVNGRRQIHIGWRLPAEERGLIDRLLAYRRSLCGDEPEIALFGSTALPHKLDVRKVLEKDLVELLRWATGRAVIRPHHLRHGMGSFCTVSQFDLPVGSFFAQSISEYFCCAENPGGALRLALLGSPNRTRRIMYAISAETGHGSPRMLLSVYANCLDIALACHLWASVKETLGDRNEADDLKGGKVGRQDINKYARAAALSGLSDARLRRLMHEEIDVTDPAALAKYLVDRQPIDHGVTLVDPKDFPTYEPSWSRSARLTLEQLHGVVAAAVGGSDCKRIAEMWAVSEEQGKKIVTAAKELAANCRYDRYGTKAIRNSWAESEPTEPKQMLPIPSSKRGGDAYEMFGNALARLGEPFVDSGLRAWARLYRSSRHGLVCGNDEELLAFWNFLIALGYEKERLVIALPIMPEASSSPFVEKLQEIGIAAKHIEYMDHGYLGFKLGVDPIAPVVLVKRAKDSPVKAASVAMTVVHQCCYLCMVALAAK
ncbi:MAG: site-specific integrase [Sulfurisoma sp.]|nr:site-specific integrase [Sulfurisoma sp.]